MRLQFDIHETTPQEVLHHLRSYYAGDAAKVSAELIERHKAATDPEELGFWSATMAEAGVPVEDDGSDPFAGINGEAVTSTDSAPQDAQEGPEQGDGPQAPAAPESSPEPPKAPATVPAVSDDEAAAAVRRGVARGGQILYRSTSPAECGAVLVRRWGRAAFKVAVWRSGVRKRDDCKAYYQTAAAILACMAEGRAKREAGLAEDALRDAPEWVVEGVAQARHSIENYGKPAAEAVPRESATA